MPKIKIFWDSNFPDLGGIDKWKWFIFNPAKNIIIIRMPELHTAKYVCQVH